jgi:hypothetical protein
MVADAASHPIARAGAGAVVVFALAGLTGCAGLLGGGPHRSDQFPAGNAPEPTVATTVLSCVAEALPYGSGNDLTARFDALARAAIPAPPIALSPASTSVLCSTIAASSTFHAWRESNPPASATAVIRELVRSSGAKSIAMPAMRLYARCEQDTKTVRDANGMTVATIQENTQTCRMDRFKDVGLFLFSADGTILYRSTKRVGIGSSTDPEPEMNEVLANIPAAFFAADGSAGARPAAAAPTAATQGPVGTTAPYGGLGPTDPQIDSTLGGLDANAPADCKAFATRMCRNRSILDASRLSLCTGYVSTVNQMVQRLGPNVAGTCTTMVRSAPQ